MGDQRAARTGLIVWTWATILALLALAPVLFSRGVVLVADMVFVPFQPWKDAWLGLDGGPPRAVPADAFVSALTHVAPGDLVQKAVLVAIVVLSCVGAIRLSMALSAVTPLPAALLAGTAYAWNPYVYERFAIGHWGLLLGYAALPWLVRAALALSRGEARWPALVGWLALGAAGSPTSGLLGTVVALGLVGPQRRLRTLGVGVALNLPWLLPALLAARRTSDPDGAAAFAPAGSVIEAWVGLLGGGGIWKTSARSPELAGWLVPLVFAALLIVGVAALVRRRAWPLVVLAVGALLVAALPTFGAGQQALTALVAHVPGAGLLRDSQKFVAPWVLVGAVGLAHPASVVRRVPDAMVRRAVAALAILLPILLLPSLAWGLGGRLHPAQVPEDWTLASRVLARAEDPTTVVLPWRSYRRFTWNGVTASYDPATRLLPGEVLVSADLDLDDGRRVAGDDPRAADVGAVLANTKGVALVEHLRRLGVGWLLVEKPIRARVPADPPGTREVLDTPTLRLLRVADPVEQPPMMSPRRRGLVLAVDALVAVGLVGVAGAAGTARIRRRGIASKQA